MQSDHLSGQLIKDPDVVLIGGGIMSATLGVMLKRLIPDLTVQIIEAMPRVATESSHAWNNAGTGHAALCELNYTPENPDGSIDISKALKINEQYETSKHFWSHLTEEGAITDPSAFIRPVPHMSFVRGESDRDFLRRRHAALTGNHLFEHMQFTDDPDRIAAWAPLLLQGRAANEVLAATRVEGGTDVNYGKLTCLLIDHLVSLEGVKLAKETRVHNLERNRDGGWKVMCTGCDGQRETLQAGFVFIGAGGGALPLLQKSGIPEGRGFGGFPVSGQFLVCRNREIVERHAAKVYGKAAVGAPPMSVPHLDTRIVDGTRSLLFGPYAGFSPRFLKSGSNTDLLKSVKPDNLMPMLAAGASNLPLTLYLIRECRKSHQDRCGDLRIFFPGAENDDWSLLNAGQRVQIIKKDAEKVGRLQFGTEVVAAGDGSLASVLGASPGASTAVSIILQVLEKCFPREMQSDAWSGQLAQMVPAYGKQLSNNPDTYLKLRSKTNSLLKTA